MTKEKCEHCDEITDEELVSYHDNKKVHESCIEDLEQDDRIDAPLTVYYGNDKTPNVVGYYVDDTDGDFAPKYVKTDGWRGYFKVEPSDNWIEILDDNILSYSEDSKNLEELNDLIIKRLDDESIKYARVFSRSSNVFSNGFNLFVKKADLEKYKKIESEFVKPKEELRDHSKYSATASGLID
jgi:hypothetical protein